MTKFVVEYYSTHSDEWYRYEPITFNARPTYHNTRDAAEGQKARLQRMHPRDKFRVVEVDSTGRPA